MTYDLKEYNGKRLIRTVVYNTSYSLCRGLKKQAEGMKQLPGTYYKIEKNYSKPLVNISWLDATVNI